MAGNSVGQIGLDLVLNKGNFEKQMNGIQGLAKKAGAALASAFAIKKLIDFGAQCIELGSDLAEVQNVVDVTFPSMSKQVDQFAQNAAASFGLSETMAKQFTGTFGSMAKAFGFNEQAAYEMSTTLTGLAGDVASFYNISQDAAYTKLKSVFTGETESLKDLGIVMTQTALDSYAMANGFGKTTAKMSEAEKVALRYQFVQEQLTGASGDFIRTSDGWANQVRVLKLQFDSLKASIGQGLINVLTPVLKVINTLLGKLMTLANAFKSFTELLTGKKASGETQAAAVASDAEQATAGLNGVAGAAKKAKKETSSSGIDELNVISPASANDSGGASGGVPEIAGADMAFGALADGETAIDQLDNKFQTMFSNIQTAVQPAVDSLKRLWDDGLSKLGGFVWTGLQDFYKGFLVPVGQWVLGEGIPRFVDTINNGLNAVDWGTINESLQNLWDKLAPFAQNVGEGLLWLWENVLVPYKTWVANEVIPLFLDGLSNVLELLNAAIETLKPMFEWLWNTMLLPIAEWTGGVIVSILESLVKALGSIADWISNNEGLVQGMTITVGAFFAAWKAVELMSFIQQSGGVIDAIKLIVTNLAGATAAKLADKAETLALTAMYAKDFIVNVASSATALAKQAAQFVITTAAKIADTVAQVAMTAATVAWNAVCTIATALTTALGAAISFLTSPIGIVILIIGALIAAGVALYKNWDTVKEFASTVWEGIKNAISTAITAVKDWISTTISNIKTAWETTWEAIGTFFSTIWDTISTTVSNIFNSVKEFISTTIDSIKEKWDTIWEAIRSFFETIWNAISETVTTIFTAIKEFIGNTVQAIKEKWETVWNTIKSFVKKTWDGIKTTISNVFNSVKTFITNTLNGIKEKFTTIWNGIKTTVSTVINGVKTTISNVMTTIKNEITNALTTIKDKFTSIFTGIKDTVSGIFEGMWNGIKGVINSILGGIEGMANGVVRGINRVIGVLNNLSFDIPDWIPGLGGKTFGFNIPTLSEVSIPRLAQGGFIPANTPRLAMIGDNRRYGEIVAPEDKMQEMVDRAVAMANSNNLSGQLLLTIIDLLKQLIRLVENFDLVVNIDTRELRQKLKDLEKRTGFGFA